MKSRLSLILLCVFLALTTRAYAAGPTCTVAASGANYTSIQAAVNDAGCTTINVAAGTYLERVTIARDVTINGAGANSTIVDAQKGDRVFAINSGTVVLNGLTIQNGASGLNVGGGVYNNGSLTLRNSTISGNSDGGVYNEGVLILENSVVSNNDFGFGGGVTNVDGLLILRNSTVSDNYSTSAGGIYNQAGTLIIENSTISGNISIAAYRAGGIYNEAGTVIIENTTISGNSSEGLRATGGILNDLGGSLSLRSSTVTGNTAAAFFNFVGAIRDVAGTTVVSNSILASDSIPNCGGTIFNGGYNIDNGTSCGFGTTNNSRSSTDPLLDPNGLKANGGPTLTIALQSGSPAIDAIPNGVNDCGTDVWRDQRGLLRPRDNGCEIGAFEVGADPTAPAITQTVSGTLGNNGWYTTNVTVSSTVTDTESVVSAQSGCDTTTISSDTTGTTLTCSATSLGGTNSQAVTIKRDTTAPSASANRSPGANANGWNNTNVTVSFSGTDASSGIASCSADVTLSAEGAGQSASGTCSDNAGHVSAPASVSAINIDKTKPVITSSRTPAANANGWNNTNVNVSFTCTDSLSGVDTNTVAGTLVSTEGANQSITNSGSCTDKAGNSADAAMVSISLDKSAPSISCGSADGAWHASDVSIACSASDTLSGLADAADANFNLSTNVLSGSEDANASTNSRSISDNAGNSANAGPLGGNKIDKKAPIINIVTPASTLYLLGQVVAANYGCSDGGSGVATCVGTGASLNTSSVGAKSFTVNAADKVGNASSNTVNYTVGYGFNGLQSPYALPAQKSFNVGSSIPLSWQYTNAASKVVNSASAAPSVQITSAACPAGSNGTPVTVNTSGASGLQYDSKTNTWQYNWKTSGLAAGCYNITIISAQSGQSNGPFLIQLR